MRGEDRTAFDHVIVKKPQPQKSAAQLYLEQYQSLCAERDAIEACMADFRSRATRVSQSWQPDRVQSSPTPDGRYDAVAEGVDYRNETMPDYSELLQRIPLKAREIMDTISLVPDAQQRTVLYAKYITLRYPDNRWSNIAEYVHFSPSYTRELHQRGLEAVEDILAGRAVKTAEKGR